MALLKSYVYRNNRTQSEPFESDDESGCWSDVRPCYSDNSLAVSQDECGSYNNKKQGLADQEEGEEETSTTSSFDNTNEEYEHEEISVTSSFDTTEEDEISVTISFDSTEEEDEVTSVTSSLDNVQMEDNNCSDDAPTVMKTPDKKSRIPQFSPSPIPRNTPVVKWKRLAGGAFMGKPYCLQSELEGLKVKYSDTLFKLKGVETKLERSRSIQETICNELEICKQQRDNQAETSSQKERHFAQLETEVKALRKMLQIQQSTPSSLPSILQQRNQAVAAVEEKDRMLETCRETIAQLEREVSSWRQREHDTTTAFQKELEILQESLEMVRTPVANDDDSQDIDENKPHLGFSKNNTNTSFSYYEKEQKKSGNELFTPPAGSNRKVFLQAASLGSQVN